MLIAQCLDRVLDSPQETVGRHQPVCNITRQFALVGCRTQGRTQAYGPQGGHAAAADQLQRLNDKLDLPYPAGPELDVIEKIPALHLCRNQRMHFAQRLEYAVVQVLAIHERFDDIAA